jgi:hypothetical protein
MPTVTKLAAVMTGSRMTTSFCSACAGGDAPFSETVAPHFLPEIIIKQHIILGGIHRNIRDFEEKDLGHSRLFARAYGIFSHRQPLSKCPEGYIFSPSFSFAKYGSQSKSLRATERIPTIDSLNFSSFIGHPYTYSRFITRSAR